MTIESTPAMVASAYETMERTLKIVRRGMGGSLTLADKVLLGHLDDPAHQDLEPGQSYLLLRPTLWLSHSYGASQLEWFRAGSALNLFHG